MRLGQCSAHHPDLLSRYQCNRGPSFGRNRESRETEHRACGCVPKRRVRPAAAQNAVRQDPAVSALGPGQRQALHGTARAQAVGPAPRRAARPLRISKAPTGVLSPARALRHVIAPFSGFQR